MATMSRPERDRQDALRPGRRRCARLAHAQPGGEEAHERADETVGRHAAEIVAELAHQGGAAPARIGPDRAGEAAAHADAVPAARDPGDEDQRMLDHVATGRAAAYFETAR